MKPNGDFNESNPLLIFWVPFPTTLFGKARFDLENNLDRQNQTFLFIYFHQ